MDGDRTTPRTGVARSAQRSTSVGEPTRDGPTSRPEDGPEELLAWFLGHTPPILWSKWWGELPDGGDRARLQAVLFDGAERLRNLDTAETRSQLLTCTQGSLLLRKLVVAEMEDFVEACVRELREKAANIERAYEQLRRDAFRM